MGSLLIIQMATLSVIIPVYQSAATLERCLNSVLSQDVPDMEVILVDDGSTDGGSQLCDSLACANSCVKVIHRENGGLSAARNSGIGAASGLFVTFVDSDDEIAPHTYSGNIEWLELNPDTDMLEYPVTVHFGASNEHQLDFEPRTVSGSSDVFEDWLSNGGYSHCYACNKIYRKQLFDDVRFPEGETFEDAAVCPILVKACNSIRYSDTGRYLYYPNGTGITSNYTFKGQEPLFRHDMKLLKAATEMNMTYCQVRLWEICLNLLIDLCRCSGTDAAYISDSAKRLSRLRPSVSHIFRSGHTFKSKIKSVCALAVGPRVMCGILGIKKYN